MALIACQSCREQISKQATACPKCGHPNKTANHLSGGTVLGVLLMAGVGFWWVGIGSKTAATQELASITTTVAQDQVKQYEIAARQGDPIQKCVQAGMVTAAFLQAKDEPAYKTWKATQSKDCKKAGIPM